MTSTAGADAAAAVAFDVRRSQAPRPEAEREALLEAPAFGTVFTDHMARMSWDVASGWHDRRVEQHAPLPLDPAAAVLHYGQEVLEGLTAYRQPDGTVRAFRPDAHAARFAASARRLGLPELPTDDFLASIEALVRVDAAWVPDGDGASLYLRPFMVATEALLTVRPAQRTEYVVIASPAAPSVPSGVSVWVSRHVNRAGPGGTGSAVCGSGYAAGLRAQEEARANGCDEVCFLDAATGTRLAQTATANLFVVSKDGSVATPALDGTIVPGVMRSSVITVLGEAGHRVQERDVLLEDVLAGLADGSVTEVFGSSTAGVVTPVGRLAGEGFDVVVGGGRTGPVAAAARGALTDVQHGRVADRHGWLHRLV